LRFKKKQYKAYNNIKKTMTIHKRKFDAFWREQFGDSDVWTERGYNHTPSNNSTTNRPGLDSSGPEIGKPKARVIGRHGPNSFTHTPDTPMHHHGMDLGLNKGKPEARVSGRHGPNSFTHTPDTPMSPMHHHGMDFGPNTGKPKARVSSRHGTNSFTHTPDTPMSPATKNNYGQIGTNNQEEKFIDIIKDIDVLKKQHNALLDNIVSQLQTIKCIKESTTRSTN
jgi:hypothetical protein